MSDCLATAEPLYRRIVRALRSDILEGRLRPGMRLPSESELGQRFSVSRITVRQAVGALHNEGLIHTAQGRGSFVAHPKAYQDISRLQGFAEQMGRHGYQVSNRVLSTRELEAPAQVARRLDLGSGARVLELQRLRLLNGAPVSVELTYLPLEIGRRVVEADLQQRDIFLILENDCQSPLGHAELAIDAVAADPETAARLGVAEAAPLLRIERLTHDRAGRPLDYEFLYFRGDTFQYRFQVDRHPPHKD